MTTTKTHYIIEYKNDDNNKWRKHWHPSSENKDLTKLKDWLKTIKITINDGIEVEYRISKETIITIVESDFDENN